MLYRFQKLPSVTPDDPRGDVFEWKIPDGRQITVYHRRAGQKFAGHAHSGRDPSKNPERFLLISGKVQMRFTGQDGSKEAVAIEANTAVDIYPNVWHQMQALEDCTFIEYRLTYFDKTNPDVIVCQA